MNEKKYATESVEILEVHSTDDITWTFRCTRPETLSWEVGSNSHFSFREPTGDKETDKPHQRHMSIISHPDEPYLAFSTKIRQEPSLFKSKLKALKPGDKLLVYGFNNRMPIRREGKPLVFLSMGVGMTTCRPYFWEYRKDSSGIPYLYSVNIERNGNRLLEDEFADLPDDRLHRAYYIDRESLYNEVDALVEKEETYIYYLIGSDEFLAQLCDYLIKKRVDPSFITIDKKKGPVEFLKFYQSSSAGSAG